MNNARVEALNVSDLRTSASRLLSAGGRMQEAYAWFPEPGRLQLRYLATHPGQHEFVCWCVEPGDRAVPSLAAECPLLGWHEREMMEMCGVVFSGHPEPERLLTAYLPPMERGPLEAGDTSGSSIVATLKSPVLPEVSGRHVQLLPFGPVRADVVESAQFIFFYVGEGILHYHPNLFLKHRGIEKQFEGMSMETAVLVAERVSGVDTVAHATAYAEAVEDAAGCEVPARARWYRTIAAELERIYNHLHYLGHLCHTTTLKVGEAQGKLLEERAKQMNALASGSRFLRSLICPGGVRRELDLYAIASGLTGLRPDVERYVDKVSHTTSHLDRLITTAPLSQKLAFDQGATGPIERASGVDRDLRRDHVYAAYDELVPVVALDQAGDAHARMKVRIGELVASMDLIETAIQQGLPGGAINAPCVPEPLSEGLGWSESSRGTVLYAVHLDAQQRLQRVKVRSPSFSNWGVFPFTVHDSNMMDYAINEASFGLTISGCAR